MLGVSLVSLLIIPAIAERTIVIDKIADVKEEFLYDVLSDVKNYRQIFPEYVQSTQLIQNDFGIFDRNGMTVAFEEFYIIMIFLTCQRHNLNYNF